MSARRGCALVVLLALAVAGCTGNGAGDLVEDRPDANESGAPSASAGLTSDGPVSLTWYTVSDGPGGSPGQAELASTCEGAANGRYTIEVTELSGTFDDQAARLKAAITAGEPIDLMSLETTMLTGFATSGNLASLPDADQARLRRTMLSGPLRSQTIDGQVVAFPLFANTQLLWYRKSLVQRAGLDLSRPVTWEQLIAAAESARTTVQVQAARYEGYIVWLNALIEGAGGDLVEPGAPSGRSMARVVHELVASSAGDPAMDKTTELETHERFFSGDAGFMLNWPYIPEGPWVDAATWDMDDLGWALYPRTELGRSARPPISGVAIAVAAGSEHERVAIAAARCLTTREQQVTYMLSQRLPSGIAAVYDDPRVRRAYPMADLIRKSLQIGASRPQVANYSEVSAALQDVLWPPDEVDPRSTPREAQQAVDEAMRRRTV